MNVIQVTTTIANESDGVANAVRGICAGLKENAVDVSLHCGGALPDKTFPFPIVNSPFKAFPHPSLGRSPQMLDALKQACATADIVHSNGVWMLPNVYPAQAIATLPPGQRPKLVTAPHGTFAPWALHHHALRKKLFGRFGGQYAALAATDMWHATVKEEYDDIRRLGYRQPIAIVPNGVDVPLHIEEPRTQHRRMFFLSRIHPKKKPDLLLRCWAKLEKEFPEWTLSIVGPDKDNPYADEMKQLAQQLRCQRVTFEGELKGDDKYRFMAASDCEVLPTITENFGIVVAEALACQTPVICSQGAPWQGLENEKCGWWIPLNDDAFTETMRKVMQTPRETLQEMGARGRAWMQRDYAWSGIGAKMKAAYAWLLGQGDRPDWVITD